MCRLQPSSSKIGRLASKPGDAECDPKDEQGCGGRTKASMDSENAVGHEDQAGGIILCR
jgi:hypothetical protein